jgi:hypothetical protein
MKTLRILAVALGGLVSAGCLVNIETVADPRAAFAQAREEAMAVQGRPGPAHHLNVLVWDRSDRQLVRVSLPMWIARKIEGSAHDVEHDLDDEEAEELHRTLRRHVRLEDLEKAGLGLLVEVEEDDGEQVLVWLK